MKSQRMNQPISLWLMLVLSLLVASRSFAAQDLSDEMRAMQVKGVTMDPYGKTPIVILEDVEKHQAFPIWIGLPEAQAIIRALEGIPSPRPMTHMLLQHILHDLQVEVSRVVINDVRNNTFYAAIFLRHGSKTLVIDARPSDALALALGVKAPVYATKKVLGSIRMVPLAGSSPPLHLLKKFGLHLQNLDVTLARAFHLHTPAGVLVAFVENGSQAERDGMQSGDVITHVDGQPITDLQNLLKVLNAKTGRSAITLQVIRKQRVRVIHLSLTPQK